MKPIVPQVQPGGRGVGMQYLPVALKLVLLLSYIFIIFASRSPLTPAVISLLIIGLYLANGISLRNPAFVVLPPLSLGAGMLAFGDGAFATRLATGITRVVCLLLLARMFVITTRPAEIFYLLDRSALRTPFLNETIYVINTTLAVLPGIQVDLQRAIDAETLRQGHKVRFYSLGVWATILTVLLVRSLMRAERLTDAVVDRGYSPSRGLTPPQPQSVRWADLALTLLLLLPGWFLFIVWL